jgi:multicomponent Na+:H+ antiporter subunit E
MPMSTPGGRAPVTAAYSDDFTVNRIKKNGSPLSDKSSGFPGKGYKGSTLATRGVLFSLIWWVLSNGDVSSWWIGVPAVVFAVMASVALIPPTPLVWRAWLGFVPFFLIRSLMGGVDVAWRAFHPRLPIAPELIEYPLRLPPGLPQVVMVNTVSLLPGTLCAELGKGMLKLHVLDGGHDFKSELEAIEQHVVRMFGLFLNVDDGGK